MPIVQSLAKKQSIESLLAATSQKRSKKKSISSQRAEAIQRQARKSQLDAHPALPNSPRRRPQSVTPPPQMELIRPGKRRVKVTANAVESTPCKRMRVV